MQRFVNGDSNAVYDMVSCDIEVLAHPPYNPDFAPFTSYNIIKEKLRENWFTDTEEAAEAYEKVVKATPKSSAESVSLCVLCGSIECNDILI
ncbi:hypothetical protein EVAR_5024_1 [Eumeta japonica]|uniref:Histone-lysine N-methyltransferase SETMAR n=1 Tax=Eumeta variegata TaxID=151549 RepID=A0A4C1SWY9_EUMVA|nr:hypothetical protein EVAR_5024_1 [Eumeta japonica]